MGNLKAMIGAAFSAVFGAGKQRAAPAAAEPRVDAAPRADMQLCREPGSEAAEHVNAPDSTAGGEAGAGPNPYFDSDWYLDSYPDVRASGADPLVHYSTRGWREGRNPSAAFDGERYLDDNPDLRAGQISPLQHYLTHGRLEKRAIFNVADRASRPLVPPAPPTAKRKRVLINVGLNSEGDALDSAIAAMLRRLAPSCAESGPISIVFALSRLGGGAGAKTAVSFAEAYLSQRLRKSALLVTTDDRDLDATARLPPHLHVIRLAEFGANLRRNARIDLLLRILEALRPEIFHIVESELAWSLLQQHGRRIRRLTRVFASLSHVRREDEARVASEAASAAYFCEAILTDDKLAVEQAARLIGEPR